MTTIAAGGWCPGCPNSPGLDLKFQLLHKDAAKDEIVIVLKDGYRWSD